MNKILFLLIAILLAGLAQAQNDPSSAQAHFPYGSFAGSTSGYTQLDSTSNTVTLPVQYGDVIPFMQITATEDSGTVSLLFVIEASFFLPSGTQYWQEIDRDTATSTGSFIYTNTDLAEGDGAVAWRVTGTTLSSGATGQWTWNVYTRFLPRTSANMDRKSKVPHFPYNSMSGLTSSVTQSAGATNYINLPQQKGNYFPRFQVQTTENSGTVNCTISIQASFVDESGTQVWKEIDTDAQTGSGNIIYTTSDLAAGKGASDWRVGITTAAGTGNWTALVSVRWLPIN